MWVLIYTDAVLHRVGQKNEIMMQEYVFRFKTDAGFLRYECLIFFSSMALNRILVGKVPLIR